MDCPVVRTTSWVAVETQSGSRIPLRASNIYNVDDCHLFRLDPTADWPTTPFEIRAESDLPDYRGTFNFKVNPVPEL